MARAAHRAEATRARSDIETIPADGQYREGRLLTYPQNQQEGRTAGINGILGVTYAASTTVRSNADVHVTAARPETVDRETEINDGCRPFIKAGFAAARLRFRFFF